MGGAFVFWYSQRPPAYTPVAAPAPTAPVAG
ncbi:MAG: hypothetical protein JWR51_4733, partial [Devosia sp.]|nr:hypothetical protein [Devosia sp.]